MCAEQRWPLIGLDSIMVFPNLWHFPYVVVVRDIYFAGHFFQYNPFLFWSFVADMDSIMAGCDVAVHDSLHIHIFFPFNYFFFCYEYKLCAVLKYHSLLRDWPCLLWNLGAGVELYFQFWLDVNLGSCLVMVATVCCLGV